MRTRLVSLLGACALVAMLPGCAFISRASETATGAQGDSVSSWASLSENGRWVAFRSFASNLVPGDTNGTWDVFVRDNVTKQVARERREQRNAGQRPQRVAIDLQRRESHRVRVGRDEPGCQ